MILPIYTYGQPVLRDEAENIDSNYPNLKELLDNMFQTMNHADGVGLAAPQVGGAAAPTWVNIASEISK